VGEDRYIRAGRWFRRAGAGVLALLGARGPGVRAFVLHAVEPSRRDDLDRILDFLQQRGPFLSPAEFFTWLDQPADAELDREAFLLTFDDGLASSGATAHTVLARRGIAALFFVPTAVLELGGADEMRRFAEEHVYGGTGTALTPAMYEVMTPEQLIELRAAGHMILPHTHSHRYLPAINDAAAVEAELVRPKQRLEQLLGEPLRAFAFPGGADQHGARYAYDAVREIYNYCFTGLPGRNQAHTDRHYLWRTSLHPEHPVEHVRNLVDGVYDPYYALRMRRLKAVTS
jgi:peptidoglycan/xylan/chitin deacetylase (PgdA/CDA1 family)